jgi:GT2 family glycosyltransferase
LFLDDDTVLEVDYFEEILKTYQVYPDALGAGGYINNETEWEFVGDRYNASLRIVLTVGSVRGFAFYTSKKLGLDSDCLPGYSSYIRMVEVWVFTSKWKKCMKLKY